MKICIDIDSNNINSNLIKKLIDMHKLQEKPRLQKLEDYYLGKQDILKRVLDADKPNNKLVTNYCSYITDTVIGFFIGSPVIYNSKNKEYLQTLKNIFTLNDEAETNIELARKASIKGKGCELIYIDELNNIRFDVLDTDEVILVYDTTIENELCMAIRYFSLHDYVLDTDIIKVEAYTKDKIYCYTVNDGNLILNEVREHYFAEVPVVEYANNIYRTGDFEKIITLQDNYNLTQADLSNELSYFRECYLKLKGMEGSTPEDIAEMKKNRVLLLGENDEAEFMVKEIKDTVIQNHLKNIKEDIHKTSYVPDLSQELPANLSGSAIKQKFFNTEQLVVRKERHFKKALQKRIRLITNILNLKGFTYSWQDIDIVFSRNLPINYVEMADSAVKLKGIISNKSLIGLVAGIVGIEDVDKELEQLKEEQNETFNLDLIPTVTKINTNGYTEHTPTYTGDVNG